LYSLIILCFTGILPALFTAIEYVIGSGDTMLVVLYKWFIFCALGLRLCCAGLVQLFKPSYTLQTIFKINDTKSAELVQELGVHNVLVGLALMSTLIMPEHRAFMTCIGSAYFGIAGVLHAVRHEKSYNQFVAMVSDIAIAVIALSLLCVQ
jgi:hypothetical protein